MKTVKILFLTMLVGGAVSVTAKGADFSASDAFNSLEVMADIKQCQETVKNLDQLLKLSAKLVVVTQHRWDNDDKNADALADYKAASEDYDKLMAWRQRMIQRLAYDQVTVEGLGLSITAEGRQAAKDAARDARESSSEAARQTGTDAARDAHGMVNCKDGH